MEKGPQYQNWSTIHFELHVYIPMKSVSPNSNWFNSRLEVQFHSRLLTQDLKPFFENWMPRRRFIWNFLLSSVAFLP